MLGRERMGVFLPAFLSPSLLPMVPTLSVYVAPDALYGIVAGPGTKGLQLEAIAAVPYSEGLPLAELRQQLDGTEWSALTLVLDSSMAAVASFPIEADQSIALIREQVELEIIQQFLGTPSEGYTADVYRIGPDVQRNLRACAVCLLPSHRTLVQQVQDAFGSAPRTTIVPIALAAAFAYNYPEQSGKRCALAFVGSDAVELITVENQMLLHWVAVPSRGSVETALQQAVRQTLVACGEARTLYLAGIGLTRRRFEQVVIALEGRFAEPVALLDGFRMVQCGLAPELCQAAAPLGHVFTPAIGGAVQPLYLAPTWTLDARNVPSPA